METITLINKTKVLAKGLNPVTYTNDTQAAAKVTALKAQGVNCEIYITPGNRVVRLIKINN